MGTISVYSPFSGDEVKILPKDLGKAVRDREGRLFYVLPRSDKKGYYAAPSRAGGERDEQRYLQLLAKLRQAKQSAHRSGATTAKAKAAAPKAAPATQHAAAKKSHTPIVAQYGQAASVRASREQSRRRAGRGGSGFLGLIVVGAMVAGTVWLLTLGPLQGAGQTMWHWIKGLIGLFTG